MDEFKDLIKAYDLRNKNYSAACIVGLIGILSLVNCIFIIFRYDFNFTAGFGILSIFQIVLFELVPIKNIAMASASIVLISIVTAGYMVYLGIQIAQGEKTSYIIAIVTYCIDTLILFYCSEFVGVIIHSYLLWVLYEGYKGSKELEKIKGALEKLDEILYSHKEECYETETDG